MNKYFILIMAAFASLSTLIFGCSTMDIEERQELFLRKNNYLIGKHVDKLLLTYGVPTAESSLSNGGRILEYSRSRTEISGGGSIPIQTSTYIPNPNGGAGIWVSGTRQQPIPVNSSTLTCKVIFLLNQHHNVQEWRHEGNACY